MDFIQVGADHWNFETAAGRQRFIPFGANFIFYDPSHPMKWSLNILTKARWEPETIRRVFEGARDLNMNLMKVFLPGPEVLPDPQTNDTLRLAGMAPSLFERLDFLFDVARQTGVYVSLSFAEWGMAGAQWFHEGGTFMGRHPDDGPGVDSFAVFRNFWRALAQRYHVEPALFSYNLAVELYLPDGNWGAGAAAGEQDTSQDTNLHFCARWGEPAWQRWLWSKYASLDGVNAAWGTRYSDLRDIKQPEIKWLADARAYSLPQVIVADYISFKECITYAFLQQQAAAIRSVDTRHMIACGLHPDQSGLAPAGWAWKICGITHRELDFLDYLTPHLYTHIDYLVTRTDKLDDSPGRDAATLERRRREALLYARFMAAGKPLLLEEMGHAVSDPAESLTGSIALAEALCGHVSGLQIWFLGDVPKNDTEWHFGPLSTDLRPNRWGEAWKKLAEPGGLLAVFPRQRVPARTVIPLDRLEGLAPVQETIAEQLVRNWDAYDHPIDFEWPRNPMIAAGRIQHEVRRAVTNSQKGQRMEVNMTVFDRASFANPADEYRPLQIVHGLDHYLLDPEHLAGETGIDQRLELLKRMGLGGIVTNVGFKDYLVSTRQWEIYRYGLKKADELGLVLWLYDEKGYPSGSAGGIVTRSHPEYANLGVACYRRDVDGPAEVRFDLPVSCRRFAWAGATADPDTATRAGVWDLSALVDAQGTLRWNAPAGKWSLFYLAERVMYEGTHATGNVCDFKQYINLLNPAAVGEFLRVTHEQYVRETPPELWHRVRAVFTDEPSLMTTYVPELPERFHGKIPVVDALLFTDRPPAIPWVEDLPARFQAIKGYDLRPYLFALFASSSEEACYVRQDFYDVITRLYTDAFYTQVLRWCQAHGIASSGHVLAEENLLGHVAYHGSLFAPIRQMDLPGIDMLNSDPQDMLAGDSFMTIKQVASAAHLCGRRQIHSESSDWVQHNQGRYATLAERRGQGNLQYVLGVNQITAYWGWNEIGEDEYRQYNDYMGRLASLLTGGQHVCDVAVLYPVRSAWAHFVPLDRPLSSAAVSPQLRQVVDAYPALVRYLLRSQVDLDIVDEEAVVTGQVCDGALCVAGERYRAIVLPPSYALGLDAARALAAFARAGGLVVSTGPLPALAESAQGTAALRCEFLSLFDAGGPAHVTALEQLPDFLRAHVSPDLTLAAANADILYTHRCLEGRDLYFIINNAPQAAVIQPRLRVPGPYTIYRPLDGSLQAAVSDANLALAAYEGIFVVVEA